MKLRNSLSKKTEKFVPLSSDGKVGVYTCGPTVYSFVTVGNWRTYTLGDVLVRSLVYLGYEVDYVMNITDVGHLTGDNKGDADIGEDRMEQAAQKEGKSAWDIAEFYTNDFLKGYDQLNLVRPRVFSKATSHIDEQVKLISKIRRNKFAYKIDDGIYFDTKAYEKAGNKYGELSTLDQVKEGARVEVNPQKKDPRDFALWKFSLPGKKRQMEWPSPWRVGFPGWHIECSAMSMKYLGESFDIHVGGEDLRSTHHPNEIAQSEAATGKRPFVNYWVHGAFLLVDGGRMGKSLGNAYNLGDVIEKGYAPMALRYFYLGGHYRKQLNFTWEGLDAAQKALAKLKSQTAKLKSLIGDVEQLDMMKVEAAKRYLLAFVKAIETDLNTPQALAVLWEVMNSRELSDRHRLALVLDFDRVLGLDLGDEEVVVTQMVQLKKLPRAVAVLVDKREVLRKDNKFSQSDKIRKEIEARGYSVEDSVDGPVIRKL